MNQVLQAPPKCEKHGCEKAWVKDNSRKCGHRWRCLACLDGYRKKSLKKNPERVRASGRARALKWKRNNPEKVRANEQKQREKNPEKSRIDDRKWRKANPEKVIAKSAMRRARVLNAVVPGREVTVAIQTKRKALFCGCCFCGSQNKLTLEHVTPLNKGGLHVEENLLGSCKSCNSSKHVKPVESWYRAQPFFDEQRWQRILEVTSDKDQDNNVGTAS